MSTEGGAPGQGAAGSGRPIARRTVLAAGGLGAGAVLLGLDGRPARAASGNKIQVENAKPGHSDFWLNKRSDSVGKQVLAYTRQHSAKAGQTVQVCVSTSSAQTATASVYRMGYYGGAGARKVLTLGPVATSSQPIPAPNPTTGELACNWSPTFSFTVGSDWTSGIYLVKVVASSGYDTYATFTVRDDRNADFFYQQPITTYAAYNNFPDDGTGKSLYHYNSVDSPPIGATGQHQAIAVTLDRPYEDGGGCGTFLSYELDLVYWLEKQGYDVTYATVVDVHHTPSLLLNHKGLISAGHDEYWTREIYEAWFAARDAGVSLFFATANTAYWRIRLGNGGRRIESYKEWADLDPHEPETGLMRTYRPEQELVGVQYVTHSNGNDNTPFVPVNTNHWVWKNAGVTGAPLTKIVGYEIDTLHDAEEAPVHPDLVILGASPFSDTPDAVPNHTAHASIYRAPSGAWVFATGTISWAWGLARSGYVHPAIQQATKNVLDRFLADGAEPPPDPEPEPEPEPEPTNPGSTSPFAPFASATAFVKQQYRDLLGREADPGGLAYWRSQLRPDGKDRAKIVEQFIRSAEFAPWFPLARLYQAVFDRIPDPQGYWYWFQRYTRGELSLFDIASYFVQSPEWVSRYGLYQPSSEVVTLVYRNLFKREPDPVGHAYWTSRLDAGMSRAELVLGFSESAEFKKRYAQELDVIALYQGLLRRPPTKAQFDAAVKEMERKGKSTRQMAEQILSSKEYARRF